MKTRWSLSLPPLWSSVHRRTSSHTRSSSHRWSTFSTFTLWSLFLALCCLVAPTLSHPYPFLYQRAYARNIRPLPCVAKGGDTGVCMFAWDCMKANGTHLGTCIDRFYFGSCCKLDSKKRPTKPVQTPEETNQIIDTPSVTVTVKPSPINKPGLTGTGMPEERPELTGSVITDSGMKKPEIIEAEIPGSEMTGSGLTKPETVDVGVQVSVNDQDLNEGTQTGMIGTNDGDSDISGGVEENPIIDTNIGSTGIGQKPDLEESEVIGVITESNYNDESGITDTTESPGSYDSGDNSDPTDVIGEGQITGDSAIIDDGLVDGIPVKEDTLVGGIVKPGMTGPEMTSDSTDSDITEIGISRPELTGSVITDSDLKKPEIIEAGIPGSEITGSGITKPETVDVGVQVSVNDQDLNEETQTGMIVTDDGDSDISGGVEENSIIDTNIGSTGISQKPDIEESEVIGVITESNYNDESGITVATESPGSYDSGDNSDPIDVIGDGQITGDSASLDDGLDDGIPVKEDALEQDQGVEGSSSSDESTNKPEVLYVSDETQESSTESADFPEMEPVSPIRPPTTDSPFDEVDKEIVLPQSFVTTFAPLKQSDEDQNVAITVIPSAGKPAISNYNKTDNETDDDIELITFLPTVTIKIEVDQDNNIENTESIFNDISITATEPSEIASKPDIIKPGVVKPDAETVTELPGIPEESTVLGHVSIQLPGFPGINVIKPPKPSPPDGDDDENETPVFPITVIPAAIKPTPTPDVEDTTEIKKPEAKPPGEAESSTVKNIEEFTDLIIISTTTESEQPLKPITNIPEESIKPTTNPMAPGTDDSTDWKPIIFPGMQEKPKPTEKPVDNIDTQVQPLEEDIEVAASTTITSLLEQEVDLLDRLNSSKYTEICGRPVYPTKRIVGGSDASFGEFPWQVSLRQWRSVTFLHKCGAALLNENWAVTAAHCVENVQPEQLLLRLGEFDLERADEPYGFVERKVQIIATHPQFDARTFEYDLALLRFYEPVNFQPNIIPICIPQDDYNYIGDTGFVSGWGRLYEDGPLPSIMQKVPVPVITNPECEAMYKVAGYVEHIPQIFICAGYEAGLKDSCEGDSGGPMVIQRDGVWNLAGVISWGIGCALPNQPGVYTRISAFREWIEKIIVF